MAETTQKRPGWYSDPLGLPGKRYWDGSEWTERHRDGWVHQVAVRILRAMPSIPRPPRATLVEDAPLLSSTRATQAMLLVTAALAVAALVTRSGWLVLVNAAMVVVTAGCWLLLLNGIYSSGRIQPNEVRHAASWVWAGWFVPVACWVIPYQLHRDLWVAGLRRSGGAEPRPGWLLPAWWTAWLASGLFWAIAPERSAGAPSRVSTVVAQPLLPSMVILCLAVSALLAVGVLEGIMRALRRPYR